MALHTKNYNCCSVTANRQPATTPAKATLLPRQRKGRAFLWSFCSWRWRHRHSLCPGCPKEPRQTAHCPPRIPRGMTRVRQSPLPLPRRLGFCVAMESWRRPSPSGPLAASVSRQCAPSTGRQSGAGQRTPLAKYLPTETTHRQREEKEEEEEEGGGSSEPGVRCPVTPGGSRSRLES